MTSQQTITVGASEFHNRTSELLKAVEAGVGVETTRREKPIARVTAMNTEPPYDRLNRLGMIRKAKVRDTKTLPPLIKLKSGAMVSDLIKDQQFPPTE